MEPLRLVVGLGNPGRPYVGTRHNAGFSVLEILAKRWKSDWNNQARFQARIARGRWNESPVLLCQPTTFMNESGRAVGSLARFHGIDPGRLLVVVDDADLSVGWLRMRRDGSSGGHHGLESIESHLGTRLFPRLRIGIGREGELREIAGHVLGRFRPDEVETMEKVFLRAAEQVECWLGEGASAAMNRFNGSVGSDKKKDTM